MAKETWPSVFLYRLTILPFVISHLPSIQDGKPWALKQVVNRANGSEQLPVGDACEACYSLHQEGFPYLSWHELCKQNEDAETVKSNIAKARSAKAGSSPAPPVARSTATHD
eukprot:4254678-Pyramimonas_sp.AAC.1